MLLSTREHLLHSLYEAAELEHDLMCTYLYAAFSLKTDTADGLTAEQVERAFRWRRTIVNVAIQEMGHLAAVCNITSALGGAPRFGRGNFPLDPGALPASVIARLAPFDEATLQHFLYLERPVCSSEGDGTGFTHRPPRERASTYASLTPMPIDYDTVGAFYAKLGADLRAFVEHHGERAAFCNDPALQLTSEEVRMPGVAAVQCTKSALAAFAFIVEQGEGAPGHRDRSHYQVFREIHDELVQAKVAEPGFVPALPVARDPVLRPPLSEERIWITDADAAATVDLGNACYALMLRLLAYAYQIPRGIAQKRLAVDLGLGLMQALTPIAERAARLPAGPAHPAVNAGITFTTLRDAAAFPRGCSSWRVFSERMEELVSAATALAATADPRIVRARRVLGELAERVRGAMPPPVASPSPQSPPPSPPKPPIAAVALASSETPVVAESRTPGRALAVLYDGRRCVHARQCVTGAPKAFVANVTTGPWIHPDEAEPERVIEIIHSCPSGALRYERNDGRPEPSPPVNLIALRERGPYAVHAEIQLDGAAGGRRMTLCRCGGSRNKPFCDNSHRTNGFDATGEPPSTATEPLPVRDGKLAIDPEVDGPLVITGNVEIISGTGRVVARVANARLCRCGASATKPFCDQSHLRIGFRSD